MSASLTIGIPTYDRPRALERLLASLAGSAHAGEVALLVLDDHEDHGAREVFDRRPRALASATYLANERNLGYPRSLLRLFEEVETPYLMLMADDEELDDRGLTALRRFLEARRPDFVSPRWYRRRRLPRGRVRGLRRTRRVEPEEALRAAGHAPGLVFAVAPARRHLAALRSRLEAGCSLATTYPQVILLCELLAAGSQSAFHLAAAAGCAGGALPSQLLDQDGDRYWSLDSRVRQLRDASEYLHSLPETPVRERLLRGARHIAAARVARAARAEESRVRT
jgi:hypothetical protein